MRWAQRSLYYQFTYLLIGGAALLVAPQLTLRLLFATGDYGDLFPRVAGVLLMAIGTFILQFVRKDNHQMYPTLLFIRSGLCVSLIWFYWRSGDPLFLSLLAFGAFGLVTLSAGLIVDRRVAR